MTPEEIEILLNSLGETLKTEESSNGPNVFISVIVTVAPFVFRYFKKIFVSSIEKVMEIHVERMNEMFRIMEMHIDELSHVKIEIEEQKEKHNILDKKVEVNKTLIQSIKENQSIKEKC